MELDEDEYRATRILTGTDKRITMKEYVLTNLHLDGCFAIRLKDGKEYVCYKKENTHFIKKDNEEILLDDEVNKCFMSSVREYERYGI